MSHYLTQSGSPIHQEEKFTRQNFLTQTTGFLIDRLAIKTTDKKDTVLKKTLPPAVRVFVHEIRNPLTNINLVAAMLKMHPKTVDIQKYADIINRNSARINEVVNAFLLSSRNDIPKKEYFSINQVMDEILEIANDSIVLKNISVIKMYTSTPCELFLDKPKIKIALLNVVVNAIEAMASENGELKLTTIVHNDKCTVLIEDNGYGIPPKNIKKIFQPYFTCKPNGMGIGLAATKDILTNHNAKVKVESEENKGARFIITFSMAS